MKDYYVILQVSRSVPHVLVFNQQSMDCAMLLGFPRTPPSTHIFTPFHDRSASINDIKAAYKNFALKLHPDVTGNNEVRSP